MKKNKTIDLKFERMLATTPSKAYSAWMNPKIKGTTWNMGEKLILNPKVNGFFYWLVHGTPHYGRFTKMERGSRVQYTWMSPYTQGTETTVTVTFQKKGPETLMTLIHSDLPNNKYGKAHNEGWNDFLTVFPKNFKATARKKK